jgi:hypothetical protein
MNKLNNIENLYKEYCDNDTEPVPQDIWNRIENSLDKGKRIIWLRRLSIAASLTIFVSLVSWLWFSVSSIKIDNEISNIENIQGNDNIDVEIQANDPIICDNEIKFEKSDRKDKYIAHHLSNNVSNNNIQKNTYFSDVYFKEQPVKSIYNTDNKVNPENYALNKIESKKIKEEKSDKILQDNYNVDLFFNPYYDDPVKNKKQQTKIELGGSYSPVYSYRQTSETNPYFPNTSKNIPEEKGIIYGGGGLNLNIKFKKNISVETGVKYAKLGHRIDNPEINNTPFAPPDPGSSTVVINQVFLGNSMGTVTLNKKFNAQNVGGNPIPAAPPASVNIVDTKPLNTSIEQNLDYLEVPVTLRYYLIDNKFAVSMAAGLSANFLVNNSFYLETNNNKEKIGETDGISNLTMSAHAGLSLNVPIFKRISIQVEPRINYFLQEINKDFTYKYRPYSFGIYSGIKYEFGK